MKKNSKFAVALLAAIFALSAPAFAKKDDAKANLEQQAKKAASDVREKQKKAEKDAA